MWLIDSSMVHTVQSNNAEDEDNGQGHDHNGVDLQSGRLISV
jgi:hypothetical protein